MMVVDRLTKMAHYAGCRKDMNSIQFAHALIKTVFCHHGVSERIISDRGTLFTSHFWRVLAKRLGADHRLSTSFHSQTDGQTERQNQTLEQYLRCYANFHQDNWMKHLPLAEYTYNASFHSVIQATPFKANFGRDPVPFALHPYSGKALAANADEMAKEIVALQEQFTDRISEAQTTQAKYYDKNHTQKRFNLGEQVMLRTTNLKTERPSKKLDVRLLGPFKVVKIVGLQAYRLSLPTSYKMHPVFHVSLLEPYHQNKLEGRTIPPPPPVGQVLQEGYEE